MNDSRDKAVQHFRPQSEPAAVHLRDLPPVAAAETGGRRDGPEPTRYGDWEKQGRCIDF